jgi:hypothetical protein
MKMALQKKTKCEYHEDGILADLHPNYRKYPESCPWCHGKLEYDTKVGFEEFDGNFEILDWQAIDNPQDDIEFVFNCSCGDRIFLMGFDDIVACKCGKVYRLTAEVYVDKTYIDRQDELIEKSNQEEKARLAKYMKDET